MSQQFFRDGKWLSVSQIKEYNSAKNGGKKKVVPEEIKHIVTEEEVVENNLEEFVGVGEEVEIPMEEKPKPRAKKNNKK